VDAFFCRSLPDTSLAEDKTTQLFKSTVSMQTAHMFGQSMGFSAERLRDLGRPVYRKDIFYG